MKKSPLGSKIYNTATKRYVIKSNHGWIEEHRYVMEQQLNRRLLPSEIVHHIDHDHNNNVISNLEITTRSEHARHHMTGRIFKHSEESKAKISRLTKEAMARPDVQENFWKGFNKHLASKKS